MILILLLVVLVLLLIISIGWMVVAGNNLVAKRNRIDQCWSGISIVIKQRNDMIPNLLTTVKTYAKHEHEVLTQIAALRGEAMKEGDVHMQMKRNNRLSSMIGQLKSVIEAYPDLKANEQFVALQSKIVEMEEELQAMRRTYNAAVTDYNNSIEMFPSSLIASQRGYERKELLEIPQEELGSLNIASLI